MRTPSRSDRSVQQRRTRMEATLRGELRIALPQLAGKKLKEDLIKGLLRSHGVQGTDGTSSSGAVVRQATHGLDAGRPRLDRRCCGSRVDR